KPVALNLRSDVEIWSRSADRRELITEVAVKSIKPPRQLDPRFAILIQDRITVVDVHHVRRFNERVREILVGRIQRMVNFECAATFGDGPAYRQVPVHPSVALRPHTQALGAGRADGGERGHSHDASPAALSRTLDTPAQAGGILIDENSAPRSCS